MSIINFWDIPEDEAPIRGAYRTDEIPLKKSTIENGKVIQRRAVISAVSTMEEWSNIFDYMSETNQVLVAKAIHEMAGKESKITKDMIDGYRINAGVITPSIKADSKYKRSLSKKPNWVDIYRGGRFAPIDRKRRIPEHHLIELLHTKDDLDIEQALLVSKALARVTEWDNNDERFCKDTGGSYATLSEDIQKRFFDEFIYTKKKVKHIGYKVKENSGIKKLIKHYLVELEAVEKPIKADKNSEQYVRMNITDISKMSLCAQTHLLKNLVYVKDFILYVRPQHKQEIGNQGRRYNILNEIARDDRQYISELGGADIATALQTILIADMKRIAPDAELPLTQRLINDKKAYRAEIAETMGYTNKNGTLDITRAKMEITAIYQGRWYKKYFYPMKTIFDERDTISKAVIRLRLTEKKTKRIKYATSRTETKMAEKFGKEYTTYEKGDDNYKTDYRNTFLFFYWTYMERKIQNIVARVFKSPITLHDAVYTQNKEEYDMMNIERIQKQIKEELDLNIKIEKETNKW
ncbi:hypothetical protein SAMN06313540_1129 [Epsilonproteobacteria bacterium SCGC AD-308-E02]|nr:hypothetical protein SAMN06313540_1129 [Epsilonproteobacteria bacterium SCGC AD-308-E02]